MKISARRLPDLSVEGCRRSSLDNVQSGGRRCTGNQRATTATNGVAASPLGRSTVPSPRARGPRRWRPAPGDDVDAADGGGAVGDAPASRPRPPPTTVTVDQITDNPGAYYGVAVKVVGDVEDVLGPRAFTVEDQDLLFDEKLLVVSARPFAAQPEGVDESDNAPDRNRSLSAAPYTCSTRRRSRSDSASTWPTPASRSGRAARLDRRPADGLVAGIAVPWPGTAANDPVSRGQTTIEAISMSPMIHMGQAVTVGGWVGHVFGDRAFVVEDGDLLAPDRLLVVTRRPASSLPGLVGDRGLSTDGYVWVSGTVQQFDEVTFEQQLGISLEDGRYVESAGGTAIIAGSVIPVCSAAERHPPMATTPGRGRPLWAAQGQSSGEATGGQLQGNTGIDAILNAPDSYVGRTLTVNGQVDEIVGTRSSR